MFDCVILNKNGFLMDLGEGKFRLGATYEWDVLDDIPTREGAGELRSRLEGMVDCTYQVRGHEAGVRPSSVDRRPIMGSHPLHPRLLVFNGLGTKGVMLAPWFAAKFVNFCRWQEPLNPEVNVSRFYGLYDAEQKA
jgi:glycine oxidase